MSEIPQRNLGRKEKNLYEKDAITQDSDKKSNKIHEMSSNWIIKERLFISDIEREERRTVS